VHHQLLRCFFFKDLGCESEATRNSFEVVCLETAITAGKRKQKKTMPNGETRSQQIAHAGGTFTDFSSGTTDEQRLSHKRQ
jgi:hypothetical protein